MDFSVLSIKVMLKLWKWIDNRRGERDWNITPGELPPIGYKNGEKEPEK